MKALLDSRFEDTVPATEFKHPIYRGQTKLGDEGFISSDSCSLERAERSPCFGLLENPRNVFPHQRTGRIQLRSGLGQT